MILGVNCQPIVLKQLKFLHMLRSHLECDGGDGGDGQIGGGRKVASCSQIERLNHFSMFYAIVFSFTLNVQKILHLHEQ